MNRLFLLILLGFAGSALAQNSSRFEITRGVVAGGGTTPSSSSRFQLSSTIAQPLAAVPGSARFSLQGGFWIQPPPIFFAPQRIGDNFAVSVQSEAGKTYSVQYLPVLGASWQTLTNFNGNGNIITVTNPLLNTPQQYYRLLEH